jgi:dienelactone hydrolase
LPRTVTFRAALVVTLWCVVRALMADGWATPLERVEFESASQRLISGALLPGERIQGDLAKPDGAGPFPAVIGLHGCAGMHDTTKQRLADDFVSWGYVILLVDSFATRGIEQACTGGSFFARAGKRPSDAYGGLAFLARQSFVDPQRVGAVGWAALWIAETYSFVQFVLPNNVRFRAGIAFYPPCMLAGASPEIPTLIFIGALDDWTPAGHCAHKVAGWRAEGAQIEHVVYPSAHHSFYYSHLQPGMAMFGHWLEYNEEAARCDPQDAGISQALPKLRAT